MSGIFTRPRTEQRPASGAYLPVLARVEINGATRSFQVLQIQSNQWGRMQVDCALDGSLHALGIGGGVGEFTLVCIDGPIIDCDVREMAKTTEDVIKWLNPFVAYWRLTKKRWRTVAKLWKTYVSDEPYKTESPLQYYINDMKSMEQRCAKIYIYSKFESWQASDTNDQWNWKGAATGAAAYGAAGAAVGGVVGAAAGAAAGAVLGSGILDSNKQGVTGVFNGIIKDIQVSAPGHAGTGDAIMTTITLMGTWTAS